MDTYNYCNSCFGMPVGALLIVHHKYIWKFSADYKKYEDDFNVVKDYVETQFAGESDKWLYVAVTEDHRRTLYDPDTGKYLSVSDDVLSSLDTIDRYGFPDKDSTLDIIRIQGDRISFCIENGNYALVFSPNKRPSWLRSPDEDDAVRVKSIGHGWYHVTIKPGWR